MSTAAPKGRLRGGSLTESLTEKNPGNLSAPAVPRIGPEAGYHHKKYTNQVLEKLTHEKKVISGIYEDEKEDDNESKKTRK